MIIQQANNYPYAAYANVFHLTLYKVDLFHHSIVEQLSKEINTEMSPECVFSID